MNSQKLKTASGKRSCKSTAAVLYLLVSYFACGGVSANQMKMPGETPFGVKALVAGGIGGAIGTAVGALSGPMKAASLGALGGALGGAIGGAMEDGDIVTIIGTTTGGYLGGFLGGLVGGSVGTLADSALTLLSMTVIGVSASVAGEEAFGPPGAVVGLLGGALVGSLVGTYIVGPAAIIVTSGAVGAVGGAAGSVMGGEAMIGRSRSHAPLA